MAQLTVSRDFIQSCVTVSSSFDLSVGDVVDVVAGEYSRESGTIVQKNDTHLTIRSMKTNNLVVCPALFQYNSRIFKDSVLKMTVPINAVEKILVHSDSVTRDLSLHIALRSLVRVLRGPYQRRQGVVVSKSNRGRELTLFDPDNGESVS